MHKRFTRFFISICGILLIGCLQFVYSQSVTTTVQYNGAQANGCCTVCGSDYWCINNTGGCGTPSSCDSRNFFDPVPVGNEVTQVTINYYSAGCYGNAIAASINGSALPSTNEANTGCLCSNSPCAVSATATGSFPCGMPNYNYGANNSLQLCTGVDVCMDRVELVISYAPSATTGPPNQPGGITGTTSGCSGSSLSFSISSVTNATSYTWTVPAGWTITSGQGSTAITATIGASSGNVCVAASNGCGTGPTSCTAVTVSVGSTDPTSASASPPAVCSSGPTTLTLSGGSLGPGANWQWYSGSCGGTFAGSGSSISVSPSSTTTYFVRAEGGCNTTNCTSVTVTVNSNSTDPTGAFASTNPTCGGATNISVSGGSLGTGADWVWYSGGCGGASIGSGSSISVSPSSTTTYYVQAQGTCNTTICANVTVTVDQAATANAGSDGSVCGSGTYNLAGAIGGSGTSLTWSTGGTGSFNNTSLSNATYTPSPGDVSAGTVTLTITTNDPAGPCPAVTDDLVLTIEQNATAFAGSDVTICAGDPYTLSGSIGGSATALSWSSTGSGTFDNPAISSATYTPSPADISAGSVTISLTTNDPPGSCTQGTDDLVLTISTAATADAGPDNSVCAGGAIALSGITGGSATSLTWTTAGTGTFNNPALPNAIFTPSGADIIAGTVTLTLTTNDPPGSCVAATDNLTLTIEPAATANAGADASVCDGSGYTLSGSIGGSATNLNWTTLGTGTFDNSGIGNATYSPSPADISAGTVNLILTTNDPPGTCNAVSDTIVLSINQLDNASFSYSPASYCQSAPNPTPTISGLPGGTFSGSGITVNASTGEIDLTTSTVGGPYTITYATSGTCPNSSTFDVYVTTSPDATFSYSTTQYCQNGTNPSPIIIPPASAGAFSASPAGLVFVNSSTGVIDLTTSTPGNYIITNDIAAASGCPATSATTTIQIVAQDDATFSYSSGDYCISTGNQLPSVSGTPGGTFSEGSGNLSINASTGEINLSGSTVGGPYTVTYTTNGTCPNSSTVQVTVSADGNPAFAYSAASYCQSEPDPAPTISGNAGGVFSSTAGLIFISTSTGQVDLSSSTIGTYDITYNTGGACPDSQMVQITINPDADPIINNAGPYCSSDAPVNLTAAQNGGTWSGNGITNPSSGTFNPAVAGVGTHLITYDISGVCGNSDTILIIVNLDADATINSVSPLCTYDSPVTLSAAQTGGSWSGTGVNGSTFDPAISGTGNFTITYSIGGACGDTDTETITVNQGPAINAASSYCEAEPTVTLTANPSGGMWSGVGITNGATGSFDPSVVNGNTVITYITTSGCSASVTINISPKLNASVTSDTILCSTYPMDTLTAVNTSSSDIWQIINSSGNVIATLNPALPAYNPASLQPGNYTINHIIPGICGDTAIATLTIIYTPDATIWGPLSFCSNSDTVMLSAVDVSNCCDSWTGLGITDIDSGYYFPGAPGINPPTNDTVTHYITDPSGKCSSADTMIVFINNVPSPPITVSDTVCADDELLLFAYGVNDSLNWYVDSAGFKVLVHSNDTIFEPLPPLVDTSVADSVYIFYVQQQNGTCPSNYAPVALQVVNIGASFVTTPPDSGEIPLNMLFDNTSFGTDSLLDSFTWSFGDGDSSFLFNPTHLYGDTGDFIITLTVNDEFGVCEEIYTYTIHANGTSRVEVPNIFTPNGDGLNDVFNLIYKNLSEVEGIIYNRWGELIYKWSSVEAGWDGRTLSGTLAPDGVYYYLITAVGKDRPEPDPKRYEFNGYVTLVR